MTTQGKEGHSYKQTCRALAPMFFYSKSILLFFPYIFYYPTTPLDTNVVVAPRLGRRPPLSPTLFYSQALLLTILLCMNYPTPPRTRKAALTTM